MVSVAAITDQAGLAKRSTVTVRGLASGKNYKIRPGGSVHPASSSGEITFDVPMSEAGHVEITEA